MQLLLGFILSTLIGLSAWRARALSRSGALAAALCGGVIFGLGGAPWAALLLVFFLTSSVLSRALFQKRSTVSDKYAKGSQRDWGQVLANGCTGALLVGGFAFGVTPMLFWVAYAGSMAAVTADTWATELGVFSPSLPRLATTGRAVEKGTSGAVSLVGSLAALAGSLLIALCAAALTPSSWLGSAHWSLLIISLAFAGLFGSFCDSLLGASIQRIYVCQDCHKKTERHPHHSCGAVTIPVSGWSWVNNDVVNLICSICGALTAGAFWWILQ